MVLLHYQSRDLLQPSNQLFLKGSIQHTLATMGLQSGISTTEKDIGSGKTTTSCTASWPITNLLAAMQCQGNVVEMSQQQKSYCEA